MDAHHISQMVGATCIGPGHILLAMAATPDTAAGRALAVAKVTPEALRAAVAGEEARPGLPGLPGRIGEPGPGPGRGRTATPVLDELGRDLTALAIQGRIDPVIGRDDEIEQAVEVLSRRGLSGVVAGTRYRGDFEERMKRVIGEIRDHQDELIVFIDELHTVTGAGGGTRTGT
jgi:ATP-dependent Clp protease ATP-binding subunit ClpC